MSFAQGGYGDHYRENHEAYGDKHRRNVYRVLGTTEGVLRILHHDDNGNSGFRGKGVKCLVNLAFGKRQVGLVGEP